MSSELESYEEYPPHHLRATSGPFGEPLTPLSGSSPLTLWNARRILAPVLSKR